MSCRLCVEACVNVVLAIEVDGGGGMLVLLPLVSCFALFSLDHTAADDAVKAAQIEESNGTEQAHGHNLDRVT